MGKRHRHRRVKRSKFAREAREEVRRQTEHLAWAFLVSPVLLLVFVPDRVTVFELLFLPALGVAIRWRLGRRR